MRVPAQTLSPLLLAALAACTAAPPTGPSVAVMPGQAKTFEQFQEDDAICRQFAQQRSGAAPAQAQQNATLAGAAIGTVAGAAMGAAIGSASHNPATGAAIGAGAGLALGTAAGSSQGSTAATQAQRAYDIAYQQCMAAKGNAVAQAAPLTQPVAPAPYAYPYAAPPGWVWIDGAWGPPGPGPGPHPGRP